MNHAIKVLEKELERLKCRKDKRVEIAEVVAAINCINGVQALDDPPLDGGGGGPGTPP